MKKCVAPGMHFLKTYALQPKPVRTDILKAKALKNVCYSTCFPIQVKSSQVTFTRGFTRSQGCHPLDLTSSLISQQKNPESSKGKQLVQIAHRVADLIKANNSKLETDS